MATFGNQLAVLRWELQRPSSSECTHPDDGWMQQETGLLLTKELFINTYYPYTLQ